MQLTEEMRQAVDRVVRERFKGKVEHIEIEAATGDMGEDVLLIRITMSKDTTSKDFAGRFFGLTGRVRNALGEEMRGIFPVSARWRLMPDTTLAKGLIASAKVLCSNTAKRKPKQADLRRAVSAAYYAVFHDLARTCADALVGSTKSRRPNKAWVEVYRGLEHGGAKNACSGAGNVGFPQGIKDFADAFRQLQAARHSADYDPMIRLGKIEALGFIALAEDSMAALKGAGANDKLAFAAWVLITSKGANDARTRVKDGKVRRL